jgi:hypothetical protein
MIGKGWEEMHFLCGLWEAGQVDVAGMGEYMVQPSGRCTMTGVVASWISMQGVVVMM